MSLTVPAGGLAALATVTARPHETYAAAWLAGYRSPRTREAYRISITQWFTWCASKGLDPLQVVRAHIELWQRELEASGRKPRTVSLRITALASWYRYLIDEEVLTKDPVRRVRRPKIERRSPTAFLTRPQMADLLEGAQALGPHPYALVCVLALNGLRIAEACSLDVDSMRTDGFYPVLTFIRKGGKTGQAVLSRPAEAAVMAAIDGRGSGPLLLTRAGTRMNQRAAQRIIDQAMKGVRGRHGRITPHALRHSWATACLAAHVPADQVQHDGGWADPRLLSYYSHGQEAPARAATHAVAAFVFGAA